MRVLHLIDSAQRQTCPTTLAMLNEALGRLGLIEQRALMLGGQSLADAARHVGLTGEHCRVRGVPLGRAWAGWPTVRHELRRVEAGGPIDLLHCWSLDTLTVAALARPRTPRCLTLTTVPGPRAVKWLRMLCREAPARTLLLPISNTIRRELLSGGLDPAMAQVVRPGLDLGRVAHGARATLRQAWGIEPTPDARGHDRAAPTEAVRVVALLTDPPHAGDALNAALAVGLASEVFDSRGGTPKLRLLVCPDQFRHREAQAYLRGIGRRERLIQEPRLARPWEVLPGCDAALAIGPHAGGLSLLWAMAANVPIVGQANYAVSEIVEDHHSAMLAKTDQPQAVAHRLTQLLSDPQLAWKLRDSARHEAFSFFSRRNYCQAIKTAYEQIIGGQPVALPQLEVTGGLRFTGRA